eukprot:CAMPEP_0172668504 /NCGR_PEP_ID=MMETSP1074-20121228/9104_1 /TAXON_ID=2916 /ORGANISM="Ceratium fusus, Strain PA161109" /LENGTH=53 /DNA_ID=CAMNT_0013485161 /DNA_START=74 /DNA_END=232 /DNA_ORIENTATION=-
MAAPSAEVRRDVSAVSIEMTDVSSSNKSSASLHVQGSTWPPPGAYMKRVHEVW